MKTRLVTTLTATVLSAASLFASIDGAQVTTLHPQSEKIAEIAAMYKGIVKVNVTLGQKVKKGDLVFELNQDIYNAQLKGAVKNVEITKRIYEGATKLLKKNAISVQDYQWDYHDFVAAKEAHNIILDTMTNSKYYAPFDGTVTRIYRYDGSGLGDNDAEVVITEGNVKVDTANQLAMVCTRWVGIVELKVNLGQEVKKGDLLFSTTTNIFKDKLQADQDRLIQAKEIYERLKKLNESHVSSLLELVRAELDYSKATTDVEVDKLMIEQSSCYAPFDGIITKIYRYSGSGNGDGKPVVEITASK